MNEDIRAALDTSRGLQPRPTAAHIYSWVHRWKQLEGGGELKPLPQSFEVPLHPELVADISQLNEVVTVLLSMLQQAGHVMLQLKRRGLQ